MERDTKVSVSLGELVAHLGGELRGDAQRHVSRLAPLQTASSEAIAFLSHAKYLPVLANSAAGCVIVAPKQADQAMARSSDAACIVADKPYLYFARLTQWWRQRFGGYPQPGIHPSAVIEASAQVHPSASIGALCYVGAGVRIGAGTVLMPRVTLSDGCSVGERCLLHSGVVIGADGFGFAPRADQSWEKIEQLGAVRIGHDVEIGANSCVDRGALDDTVIEDGVKIDNLVQIGHNVHIGQHTAIAGNVGIAGSATVGAYCQIGGGAGILGHLTIADAVVISSCSTVTKSVTQPGLYTGFFPLDTNAEWEKNAVSLRQLHKLRERIRALERSLEQRPNN
jgi:UDP-3-O-[3-hydroxymyristoyl] glucosamine N-acyltransferase